LHVFNCHLTKSSHLIDFFGEHTATFFGSLQTVWSTLFCWSLKPSSNLALNFCSCLFLHILSFSLSFFLSLTLLSILFFFLLPPSWDGYISTNVKHVHSNLHNFKLSISANFVKKTRQINLLLCVYQPNV